MSTPLTASDLHKSIDENSYLTDKSLKQLVVDAKIIVN